MAITIYFHLFIYGQFSEKLHISGDGEILSKNDKIVGVFLHGALEIYDASTFQPQGLGSTSPRMLKIDLII